MDRLSGLLCRDGARRNESGKRRAESGCSDLSTFYLWVMGRPAGRKAHFLAREELTRERGFEEGPGFVAVA